MEAVKNMNYGIYLALTVSLYVIKIICAIFLDDIGFVFNYVSAICASTLMFIFPGLLLILAQNKYLS